jgi:ABC-2 type transport system ATP-binding protein
MSGIVEEAPQADPLQRRISIPTLAGADTLALAARRLSEAGITLDDLALRRPSLDEVFLSLTGKSTTEGETEA